MTLKQGLQHIKHNLQIRSHFIDGRDELIYFNVNLINVNQNNLPKSVPVQDTVISSNQKPNFNPLLYERDIHKLKIIQDTVEIKLTRDNSLQKLLHEVIENGYVRDLIDRQSISHKNIQQINYNEKDEDGTLILNDNILNILNELKILYHDDIHKQMGYPLQLYHICAILLYCGKSCNTQFKEKELYCGLKNIRLENIKEIKSGFFISHVSTSDDIQVAQMYRSDRGCILHFHPSMRRSLLISSCDVSWISPFKHEREILFARSEISHMHDEKVYKEQYAWNAKWNVDYLIDLNLIYSILLITQGDIDQTVELLSVFKTWSMQRNNKKKYEEKKNEFMERRCCNHHINLFFIFF
ncbi:hypothetical protein RFI_06213, partial [Reticulomyxa filosa]